MDWNKAILIGAQVAVLVTLAILVGLGHNSVITDALMAVSGSIAGTGAYSALKGSKPSTSE